MRFIDADGMESKDWIEWRSSTGTKQITYDAEIKTADQALAKGYTNVDKVFASSTGSSAVTGEQFTFQEGGTVTDGGGNAIDLSDGDFVTMGGNRINKSVNGYEQLGSGLQTAGDGVTAVGLITGQPEIAAVGSALSNIGLAIEVANSLATEGLNTSTFTKNGIKVGLNYGFGALGEAGVKATKTVAGTAAVSSGANIVSESIIQGTTVVGGKVAEKLSQDLMKKKN